MSDIFDRQRRYSDEKFSELHDTLSSLDCQDDWAVAVTGSIAKDKLTKESDIDLLVLTRTVNDERSAAIRSSIENLPFSHLLELYSVGDEQEWKWMLDHSELIGSDVYFSRFIAGNRSLYESILSHASEPAVDEKNQRNYFTYNALYRRRQLKKPQQSLKYRIGGLRDLQLVDWTAKRLCHSPHTHPEQQTTDLVQLNLLSSKDAALLRQRYADVLQSKIDGTPLHSSDVLDDRCRQAIDSLRFASLKKIGSSVNEFWSDPIEMSLLFDRYPLFCDDDDPFSGDTAHLFSRVWHSRNPEEISNAFFSHCNAWSIRAALALNPHTPRNIRKAISKLPYCDMHDISAFLSSHSPHEYDRASLSRA